MTWCCRTNVIQFVRGVNEMKKPVIKTYINPMTGETEQFVQLPNIFIYGLTNKEKEILRLSLPAKDIDVTDITGQATDIVIRFEPVFVFDAEH